MKDDTYALVRQMLFDAVAWQESLADTSRGTEFYEQAAADLKAYRAYVKRRYGTDQTASEEMMGKGETVSVYDMEENATFGKFTRPE